MKRREFLAASAAAIMAPTSLFAERKKRWIDQPVRWKNYTFSYESPVLVLQDFLNLDPAIKLFRQCVHPRFRIVKFRRAISQPMILVAYLDFHYYRSPEKATIPVVLDYDEPWHIHAKEHFAPGRYRELVLKVMKQRFAVASRDLEDLIGENANCQHKWVSYHGTPLVFQDDLGKYRVCEKCRYTEDVTPTPEPFGIDWWTCGSNS